MCVSGNQWRVSDLLQGELQVVGSLLPHVCPGNQTQFLYKSSVCSSALTEPSLQPMKFLFDRKTAAFLGCWPRWLRGTWDSWLMQQRGPAASCIPWLKRISSIAFPSPKNTPAFLSSGASKDRWSSTDTNQNVMDSSDLPSHIRHSSFIGKDIYCVLSQGVLKDASHKGNILETLLRACFLFPEADASGTKMFTAFSLLGLPISLESFEKIFAAFPRILECSLIKMAPGLIALWTGRKSPGEQTCIFLTCCSFCSLALFPDFCLAEAGGCGLQGAGAELHLHRGSLCLYRALDLSAWVNRPFKRAWGDTHSIPRHSGTCLSFTHISSGTRHGPQEGKG